MKKYTATSKSPKLRLTGLPSSALLLCLALGCSPGKDASAQPEKPSPAPAAPQGGVVRYNTQPGGGKVKIDGTSSIHEWSKESPVIGGFIEADAGFPESALKGGAAAKPKVEVFVPVRSLKSPDKKMDEIYMEHMEEPKFKKMEYTLTELKPKSDTAKDGKCEFDAVGTFTIHGKAKIVTMPVTIAKLDGGKQLKITGSTPLKMSDFEIPPVNPKIGPIQITTGDEVKMSFEWTPKQK